MKKLPKTAFRKGNVPWNKGRRETRQKVLDRQSESHIGQKFSKNQIIKRNNSRKKNNKQWHKNETKIKIKKALLRGIANGTIKIRRKEQLYNWKGGSAKLYRKFRNMPELIRWRNQVFKRDNYLCQHCNTHYKLNAHHIIPFMNLINKNNIKTIEGAEGCDELWNISNGITLCRSCHMMEHKKMKERS